MSFSAVLLSLLLPYASAELTITNITGASRTELTGTITAYGGVAGDLNNGTCATRDGTTTCDSCSSGSLTACNPTRIYDSLQLRIFANHSDSGNLIAVKTSDTTITLHTTPLNSSYVTVLWSNFCSIALGGSTCETNSFTSGSQGTIRVCLDKNSNGIYDSGEECQDVRVKLAIMPAGTYDQADDTNGINDFTPFPGDEKVYITKLSTGSGWPTLSHGGTATAVRVFIGEGNMTTAIPGGRSKDLSVVDGGSNLQNSRVDGLKNGTPYWFRLGIVDDTNNIGYFWPTAAYTDGNGADCDTTTCVYTATPDQVLGLLTNDLNCFIATAAYGTLFNEKLDTFREFRFKRLLPTEWGRRFVSSYYKYGPYAARYIHDKPVLRAVTRGLLWPAYGFSLLALRYGIWPAFIISVLAMMALVALPLAGVRRIRSRA